MRYGNKSGIWRYVSSPVGIAVLLVVFGLLVRATWGIHQKAVDSATKLGEAQAELSRLEAHQTQLSTEVGYLSSEQGIEAELRTKYHAVKNGESVAVIVDNRNAASAEIAASSTSAGHWWQRLLQWFSI